MLKVTFKDFISIKQHGIEQVCEFAICFRLMKPEYIKGATFLVFGKKIGDLYLVPNHLIKDIENVKPTDL